MATVPYYRGNPLQAAPSFGGAPLGSILSFMGTKAPEGYLVCDGSLYNIAPYPALASFFEEQFGSAGYFGGDGTSTFAVPDLRNLFLRGYHGDAEETLSGEIGTKQEATRNPYLYVSQNNNLLSWGTGEIVQPEERDTSLNPVEAGNRQVSLPNTSAASGYTHYTARPVNAAVLYCIKAAVDISELSLDEYDTEDGWHVRKWSDGYVEMDYSVTHRVTSFQTSSGVNYYVFFDANVVSYPVPLTSLDNMSSFLTSPSNVTGAASLMTTWSSPLTHLGCVVLNGLADAGSATKNADYTIWIHITGRWK